MGYKTLRVQMFGKFSLSYGDKQIACSNRAGLVWNLLAYMLYHHGEPISSEVLLPMLWRHEKGEKASGALRTAVYRVRGILSDLADDPDFTFFSAKDGGYIWNPDIRVVLDVERFDKYASSLTADEDDVESALKALELYDGKFLPMLSSEMWVIPVQTYYHNLYLSLLDWVIPRLERDGRIEKGVELCSKALQIDPYAEKTYQHLMRFLLLLNEHKQVVQIYKEMDKLFLATFGIGPDSESRSLYRDALTSIKNSGVIAPEVAMEELSEQGEIRGALVCDYAFFKMLYQAKARSVVRSGDVIHTVLLTLKNRTMKDVAEKSMKIAMDNLENHLTESLRKGDVLARCSASQFMIMLPAANFENSCKVCERFIFSFERKYPHSPLYIDYYVQAIVPSTQA